MKLFSHLSLNVLLAKGGENWNLNKHPWSGGQFAEMERGKEKASKNWNKNAVHAWEYRGNAHRKALPILAL